MLECIASGTVQSVDANKIPKSIVGTTVRATFESPEGRVIFATSPEFWESMGVAEKNRSQNAKRLSELVQIVDDAYPGSVFISDKTKPLPFKGGGSKAKKHNWYAISDGASMEAFKKAATSTPADLDKNITSRSANRMHPDALRELTARGHTNCPQCTMPVLDPSDPEYSTKANRIAEIVHGSDPDICLCRGTPPYKN